ncbi:MAG: hypothetical protein J4432_03375 [DPANN group archaeon]|nr:hypothetical protein [DPANN group archaeon]
MWENNIFGSALTNTIRAQRPDFSVVGVRDSRGVQHLVAYDPKTLALEPGVHGEPLFAIRGTEGIINNPGAKVLDDETGTD